MCPYVCFTIVLQMSKKEKIAETLLQGKEYHAAFPQKRKGRGKPKFSEEANENSSLADLTGEDSWYFFRLLNTETHFFAKYVKDWSLDEQYLK